MHACMHSQGHFQAGSRADQGAELAGHQACALQLPVGGCGRRGSGGSGGRGRAGRRWGAPGRAGAHGDLGLYSFCVVPGVFCVKEPGVCGWGEGGVLSGVPQGRAPLGAPVRAGRGSGLCCAHAIAWLNMPGPLPALRMNVRHVHLHRCMAVVTSSPALPCRPRCCCTEFA